MKTKLLQAVVFSVLAFSLTSLPSSNLEEGRDPASCGESEAVAPGLPFGTDLYAQVNGAAYKESFDYWYSYLSQVEQKATASRLSIRQAYGLDLAASSYTGIAQAAGLAPFSVVASTPAFNSFTPLATYNTMGSMNLPRFQGMPTAQPTFSFAAR